MGHITSKNAFTNLQQRLEKNPVGAPANKALFGILKELFSEEECNLAAKMPMTLATSRTIAKKANMDQKRTDQVLDDLAKKGLVVDFEGPGGRTFYVLNPPMIGFFEFAMMRVRKSIDQKKVANLMWEYLFKDPDLAFMNMIAESDTFLARPMVHEDALAPDVFSEVLDYEKASRYIEEAGAWSEALCHCRHIKMHKGMECDLPMDMCLSLGFGAEYLTRNGMAKKIDKSRALEVLEKAREFNMVQMCDNVKMRPTFICNCCKCCCEMMNGFRTLPKQAKVVTSNYVAKVDADACNGCKKCAKACPVDVIDFVDAGPTDKVKKRKRRGVVNSELCLGCGVCHRECEFDAMEIVPLPSRIHTPETMMEKLLIQAIDRGKLQNMLFDDPDRVSHRTLNTFFGALLNLSPAKKLLANQQVKSKVIQFMLGGLAKTSKGWATKKF
jgi:Na+-translocating ferredoxin:NAD+ oxidoreductase RNF subunit RnfB